VLAAGAVVLSRRLLPGRDVVTTGLSSRHGAGARPWRSFGRALRRTARSLFVLGLIASCGQLLEDVGATWSPLYLRQDLQAGAAAAGLGFIALQGAQTLGRLLGDRVVMRFGDRAVARGGAVAAGTAMAVALLLGSVPATVVAFGVVGLGIGTLIPASLRAADAIPGMPPGVGLSLVGSVLRVSVLLGPVGVGLVADATSLRTALAVVPLVAVAAAVLAGVLPTARREPCR
jgi:predicted MFS family arabinose efflux permease